MTVPGATTFTAEQTAMAQNLGIDLSKIDWTKIRDLIVLIISIFSSQPTAKAAKLAGCPDDQSDTCCACMEAGTLALQAAQKSFECAGACCTKPSARPTAKP